MTAISLAPGLIEVTVFGGALHFVPNQRDSEIQSIAATTILTLGMCALYNHFKGGVWAKFVY